MDTFAHAQSQILVFIGTEETGKQTDRQTDRYTGRQIDRQTDRYTDRQIQTQRD